MKEFLLNDEEMDRVAPELRQIIAPAVLKKVKKAQAKKLVEWLDSKMIEAWGGNRVLLSEDWESLKGVDNG